MIKVRTKLGSKPGVTLVELLIYMGLLSILLVVLTDLFIAILDVKVESETVSAVEQDSRFIISRLDYDIKRADSISIPANPGNSSSNLTLNIDGVTHSYFVLQGNLVLSDNTGTFSINGSETNISDITFKRLGNIGGKNSVKITLTVTSVAQRAKGYETKAISFTSGTR